MVGSYSSMKWFWISWMVSADLPTPPPPTITNLYSVIVRERGVCLCRGTERGLCGGWEGCEERELRVCTGSAK